MVDDGDVEAERKLSALLGQIHAAGARRRGARASTFLQRNPGQRAGCRQSAVSCAPRADPW